MGHTPGGKARLANVIKGGLAPAVVNEEETELVELY